jgi:hypothetical protein
MVIKWCVGKKLEKYSNGLEQHSEINLYITRMLVNDKVGKGWASQ